MKLVARRYQLLSLQKTSCDTNSKFKIQNTLREGLRLQNQEIHILQGFRDLDLFHDFSELV